jgi:putative methyltransferase (TIGR04325 family)
LTKKEKIKLLLPPILVIILGWIKSKLLLNNHVVSFHGNFDDWDSALRKTSTYEDSVIFEKVLQATRKLRDGIVLGEQDSITFNNPQINSNVLIGILNAFNLNKINHIVDLGGGLGTHYFQYRKFISSQNLNWTVIELPKVVEFGKSEFSNEELFFADSLTKIENSFLILISCSLQYLENPYLVLEQVIKKKFSNIILNRTPFTNMNHDRLTIQTTKEPIYNASYPAWFFCEAKLKKYFIDNGYELIDEYSNPDKVHLITGEYYFKGLTFQKSK